MIGKDLPQNSVNTEDIVQRKRENEIHILDGLIMDIWIQPCLKVTLPSDLP